MSQTVVITGANRGIGLALATEYLRRGCQVYGVCRASSAELDGSGAEVVEGIDVGLSEAAAKLQSVFAEISIDLLVNNAGVLGADKLGDIDFDAVARQFNINAMGALRVTEALLTRLHQGSKVALITSRMGSIADNTSGGYYGYRMSKAALNAAGVSLARDLKPKGIAVAILHPGYVQTDMVNHSGDISAEVAAQRLSQRIDHLNLNNTGTFWHSNGEQLPW